ncbi:DUF4166 domain-containing protein [Lysobacter sp. Root983]|uniref:DUF4166 domain-containing protein n=1 Tax=Lysobacter sp. Root983 TaxID=1736613 RepID=UPI00138F0010|nr:DUF4166 domain-containing protein [Lysobacter sp. Root983]
MSVAAVSLYRQLLGARYDALPPSVRALHERAGLHRYRGQVESERGTGWLSRLCAWATRLPPATRDAIEVEIVASPESERWLRRFAGHDMPSRLWAQDGLLCERLGLVRFGFALDVEDAAVRWRVARVHALGLPLPARWFDGVSASESEREGRYRFDVRAALPLAGLLVHYRGWLDVA